MTLVCTDVKAIPPVKGAPLEGEGPEDGALMAGRGRHPDIFLVPYAKNPLGSLTSIPLTSQDIFLGLFLVVQHQLGVHSFLLPFSALSL